LALFKIIGRIARVIEAWGKIKNQINTPANYVTLSRIILTFVVNTLISKKNYPAVFFVGLVAGITDFFDGWLARKMGQITNFGKAFDPLADKIFIVGIAYWLWPEWLPKRWLALIALGEVILISLVALKSVLGHYTRRVKLGANIFGKTKFCFQSALILSIFLKQSGWYPTEEKIIYNLIYLSLFFAFLSIVFHLIKAAREMTE